MKILKIKYLKIKKSKINRKSRQSLSPQTHEKLAWCHPRVPPIGAHRRGKASTSSGGELSVEQNDHSEPRHCVWPRACPAAKRLDVAHDKKCRFCKQYCEDHFGRSE